MATNYTKPRFFNGASSRASTILASVWERCCAECGWDPSYPASTDVALAGVKELAERVAELEERLARVEGRE